MSLQINVPETFEHLEIGSFCYDQLIEFILANRSNDYCLWTPNNQDGDPDEYKDVANLIVDMYRMGFNTQLLTFHIGFNNDCVQYFTINARHQTK